MPPFNFSYENQFMPCECCKFKYSSMTCTATASNRYKWTQQDIEERILYHAERIVKCKWYNRGDERRRLKHWTEKLARFEELKEEFE